MRLGLALLFILGAFQAAFAQTTAATSTTLQVQAKGSPVTSVKAGTVVTLTAKVTAGTSAIAPGVVKFCDASESYCTDLYLLGIAQLTKSGSASLTFRPPIGKHSYKAQFLGTGSYSASSSAAGALTVTGAAAANATTTVVGQVGSWGNYALGALVTEVGSPVALSGSVSFVDTSASNGVLATATLGASTPGYTWVNSQELSENYYPNAVATGDWNGDGLPDLAVADIRLGNVTFLLQNADGSFTVSATMAVSSAGPMAVADFNADGIADLAVASEGSSGTVAILLGNGDGTFVQAPSSPSVMSWPSSIVTADFNGDGNADLAITNPFTGDLAILLGKGDGSFTTTHTTLANTGCISSLGTGDFNLDHKADLVVGGDCEFNQGNSAIILNGNGDGTFTTGALIATSSGPGALTVADFNRDGKLDIALASGGGSSLITILLGKGDGTFTATDIGPSIPTHGPLITWGDFNGDGVVDLALPDVYTNTVQIYQGSGDGMFTLQSFAPATGNDPNSVAVADFNDDGRADLAIAASFDGAVTILLAEPTQTASTPATPVVLTTEGQHLVDASYPGNNKFDASVSSTILLWGQPPSTTTSLAITAGGKEATTVASGTVVTLTATVTAGASPLTAGLVNFCDASAAHCTDSNRVGTASLMSSGTAAFRCVPGPGQHSYQAVLVESGIGAASSSATVNLTITPPANITGTTVTTIEQSGDIGNYTLTAKVVGVGLTTAPSGHVSFLDTSYSNAVLATSALSAATPGLSWLSKPIAVNNANQPQIVTADFNGDGIPDIALANSNAQKLGIYLGKGDGTFAAAPDPDLAGMYPSGIVAGDFNGDGKADLAVAEYSGYPWTYALRILLGNGDGTFTASAMTLQAQASAIFSADLNGDGQLDLYLSYASRESLVLLGNGDGTFTASSRGAPAGSYNLPTIVLADVNGDGLVDVVTCVSGSVQVYLGNGDGTFLSTPVTSQTTAGIGWIAVGDFNGDGIPDIAASEGESNKIDILLGDGTGSFTQANQISLNPDYYGAGPLYVCDINGDGKADLARIGGSNGDVNLSFLLGKGDGTFTAAAYTAPITGAYSVITTDLNGDGRPDILAGGNRIDVLLTRPEMTETATATGINPNGPAPHLAVANYPGDTNFSASTSGTTALYVQVAPPAFTPVGGTYTSGQTLTITDATPDATIYYWASGIVQTTGWTVYAGPISLQKEGSATIQAYATAAGYQTSTTSTATYTMNLPPAPVPVINPGSGSYPAPQTITITDSAPSVSIYYTTDGSAPSVKSTPYTGPFTLSSSGLVAAIAIDGGYNVSHIATAQIYIDSAASRFVYTVAGSGNQGYEGDGNAAVLSWLNNPGAMVFDSTGNMYIADQGNSAVRKIDANTGIISTVAGNGTPGFTGDNGAATSAELYGPNGIAIDSAGNLYLSDESSGVVRKVSAATGIITTIAGSTTATSIGDGGPATAAQLQFPTFLALDHSGNLYIATQSRIRRVDSLSGVITTYVGNGQWGSSGDGGTAANAMIEQPAGMLFDSAGNLYFVDSSAYVVRKVTAGGAAITTIAGGGANYYNKPIGDEGPALSAFFASPVGIARDSSGNLYIADSGNYEVREVTASDGIIHRIIGVGPYTSCSALSGDGGPAGSSGICYPFGLALDSSDNLLVSDLEDNRIREITPPILPPTAPTATPTFSVQPGTYAHPQTVTVSSATAGAAIYITLDGINPMPTGYGYRGPVQVTGSVNIKAIAVAPAFLPSSLSSAAYTITDPPPSVVNTVAGGGDSVQNPSQATSLFLGYTSGIAVDKNGDFYVADSHNVVWKISTSTGEAKIFAGTLNTYGDTGDGGLATSASLYSPSNLAVDGSGNLYIAESYSGRVRKVAASTGIITTYAGGNPRGPLGDGGPATSAFLDQPAGLAVDRQGNLYIADQFNRRVRMVTPSGTISTFAGGGTGGLGDGGPATSASLYYPSQVALDPSGNLYIGDNYQARIRMVSKQTGNISTVAGNGAAGLSGDGLVATKAELYSFGMTIDATGKLYFSTSSVIRMVDPKTHIISTAAGDGYGGSIGDGGSATMAEFCYPQQIATAPSGSIFILDSCNGRVRELSFPVPAPTPSLSLAAGTYSDTQTLTITDSASDAKIYYTTDGSSPDTGSEAYTGPLAISSSETIKAIAVVSGYATSAVASADYEIAGSAAAPTFSPGAGTYTSIQSVSIRDTTPGATVYYTTDGSTPTVSSAVFTAPIQVSSSETIQAIATASGYGTSAVASAAYIINLPSGNAKPVVTGINPAATSAGSQGFSLTATGAGFVSSSVVYFGTTALTTQFTDSTTIKADVPAASVASVGTSAITVQSPAPGGGTSNAFQFQVDTAGATAPAFANPTATISAGSTATYSVTLPASATGVSVTCLNLPAGAACSFSSSNHTVSISTASSTPAGTFAITVVFTQTLPGAALAWITLPVLLLPLWAVRRRARKHGIWLMLAAGLGFAILATATACGGGGSNSNPPPPPTTHQATTSAVLTLVVR